MLTIAGEFVNEGFGDGTILTLLVDKGRDFRDVASSRFTIDKPWHSTRRSLLEAIEVVACILAHLVGGELASFSLGGVERGAKFGGFDLVDSMANGVLGCQKPPCGKLRLNPLGCIRCKFNFHRACSFRKSFHAALFCKPSSVENASPLKSAGMLP
jgi:hypothetical protein